ncbi:MULTISPECIES: TIGR02452 family protein [unclassified Streptomyces]|uniref:TIGR02452 family protein n=1 Tax=unclassified Streptomyces TaxID=2593676 RepID=UPI001BE57C15|nr:MULTISPECIES: TIGR02452 family protein [unclassified Streptomyces]MBT2408945.1 TIGR02452 family protein [Streptomyces sp. ISL-21]MBT2611569.1 TIGR02452 family protein [Streptomyces sp. ISL-87]
MSSRLREIARENAEIVAAGEYRTRSGRRVSLAVAVAEAKAGTRIYGPNRIIPGGNLPTGAGPTVVEVTGESSTVAARRLATEGPDPVPVAVLNFASARNPGGGYVRGAKAQEEALCRASALYETLLEAPEYYEIHRAGRSTFYTDRVIHSPGVPVFRDDRGELLETPFRAGFLTSPAPNAGTIRRQEPSRAHEIPATLARRGERVLEVAALHGYRRLVLGAWGCGVFQNNPSEVAEAFRGLLSGRFAGVFERVTFGILDRDSGRRGAFEGVFGG